MLRKILLPTLVSFICLSLLLSPAGVQGTEPREGPQPPATWILPAELYQGFFTVPPRWQVRGETIVDSGFRPFPNGFPFANYGGDFEDNQVIYGLPERVTLPPAKNWTPAVPVELNALALRRTFGEGVCVKGSPRDANGNCFLTRTSEILSRVISEQADGGHCFGIAAAAAALYNGQINPNQVGSQMLPNTNNLNAAAQRTILRLFGTQFFGALDNLIGDSPNDVVKILTRDLAGGTVPYVFTLLGEEGGHAVTPYAVNERTDEGLIEIAVYDNNFPNLARAVLVDPVSNTFSYSGSLNPAEDTLLWEGNNIEGSSLNLLSVQETLERQSCPVCIGPDQGSFVAFAAVDKANQDLDFVLLDLKGEPLDKTDYQIVSPLNPPTGKEITLPMVIVDPGVSYRLIINGIDMKKTEDLELYVMANGKVNELFLEGFTPGTLAEFVVDRKNEQSGYQASKTTSPRVVQTIEVERASLVLNGRIKILRGETKVSQRTDAKKGITRYSSNSKRTESWNMQATYEGLTRDSSFVALDLQLAPKDVLVLNYKNWDGRGAPALWIDNKGDGSLDQRVPMTAVTPALIAASKDDLYVSKGL